MSTDRELLELAAKAAGIKGYVWEDNPFDRGLFKRNFEDCGLELQTQSFNPMDNDGDALRLAVKFGADICIGMSVKVVVSAYVNGVDDTDGTYCGKWIVQGRNDAAAVRECIVNSVAEIGRAMP